MKLVNLCYWMLPLMTVAVVSQPVYAIATTPASSDQLRIHTSLPKKASDSLFSYTVEWRIDDSELYRSTGLSFLNAAKVDSHAGGAAIAKKLVTALKDGLIQLDPNWRGIVINQPQDQPELTMSNKSGYSLTAVTTRDYTNQALRYDLLGKAFNAEGVQIAIDLVLAADVEYLDGFSSKKSQTATQGDIEVTIDDHKPVVIKTDGKTTRQLEEELAKLLTASKLSDKSLLPDLVSNDTRNNKPFDGSEVQLLTLAAKSIAIDVRDPSLGVLTKFKFKDENKTLKVIEPMFMLGALGLSGLLVVAYSWYRNNKKPG